MPFSGVAGTEWASRCLFHGGNAYYMYSAPLARISDLVASELQVHVANESVTSNIVLLTVKYQ